jgi:hypothetical protein
MVGALVVGALSVTGCAKGEDGAQVHTGSSADVGSRLTSAMDATLDQTFVMRRMIDALDANGNSVARPASVDCLPGIEPAVEVVDRANHTIDFEALTGDVIAVVDTTASSTLLSRTTFSDASLVPVPWVRVSDQDSDVLLSLSNPGSGLTRTAAYEPEPETTFDAIRQSIIGATDLGPETADGEALTHLSVTLDGARFNAAFKATIDELDHPPGTFPGTTAPSAPSTRAPSVDAFIDGSGHLRGLLLAHEVGTSAPGGTTVPASPAGVTKEQVSYTFSAIGQPLPASLPPVADVVDLGALPATVLVPHAGCDQYADGYVSPAGTPSDGNSAAWRACMREQRDQAYAGKTVTQYVGSGGTVLGGVAMGASGSIDDVLGSASSCDSKVPITIPDPTSPGSTITVMPGQITVLPGRPQVPPGTP